MRRPSRATAYHEAGHAVAAARLGLVFDTVTVVPDPTTGSLGSLEWHEDDDDDDDMRLPTGIRAIVVFCGPLAQARWRKRRLVEIWGANGASGDRHNMMLLGLSDDDFVRYLNDSVLLVYEQWSAIEQTAESLILHGFLTFEQVESLVQWPKRESSDS